MNREVHQTIGAKLFSNPGIPQSTIKTDANIWCVDEMMSYSDVTHAMSFTTVAFNAILPESDDYIPKRLDLAVRIYCKRKFFFNLFGNEVVRSRKFSIVAGRHSQRHKRGMEANQLYATPGLYKAIKDFAGDTRINMIVEPNAPTFWQVLTCNHPRRDINTGMVFTYASTTFGLIISIFFFLLDIARTVQGWDQAIAAHLR